MPAEEPVPVAENRTATRRTYIGLFLVTLATLSFQILLTRIFSVTVWYHFAFLTVSIAMLGMTIGAIAVYLLPAAFRIERVHLQLARSAWLFAFGIIAALVLHLWFPVSMAGSVRSIVSVAALCVLIAIPFTASGICVALVLTRFPAQVSTLYAVDLCGAAVGCLSVLGLMWVTDGPTAVIAAALIANLGAVCFAADADAPRMARLIGVSAVLIGVFVVGHTVLANQQRALLRVGWIMSVFDVPVPVERALHESWNSHSRIRVTPDREPREPFGWGLSPILPKRFAPEELGVEIDTGAFTVMTAFDGRLGPLEYLRYDLTNLGHHLRRDADVLVLGAGAGRDVLSALVFDQASVIGIEINADILDVVHQRYGDFTGHLDRHPKVGLVNDEARSWVARSEERFDIIQISLIDSWAATAAGAFVLTEHSLYTVEAWESFLEHLKPDGILTLTRYYHTPNPATAYRMTSLATAALARLGVTEPRGHIAMVRTHDNLVRATMVTILVGRSPFSPADFRELRRVTRDLRFQPVLDPEAAVDQTFATLANGGDLSRLYADYPLDIEASTDDRPFFFHMLRLSDIFDSERHVDQGFSQFNIRAVIVLGVLLATVSLLTLIFVIVPLLLRRRLTDYRAITPWFLLFAGIGAGFMMVEVSQIERLIVFLGHPVYSLSVVLFTLLLASGLGSYSTNRMPDADLSRAVMLRVFGLLVTLALFGAFTPVAIDWMEAASTPARVLTAVGLLAPIGFFMGMVFPLGIKAATLEPDAADLTPWLWGMNGSTSVLASVLAIVVAMSFGITVSFWIGFGCYVVAGSALLWLVRTRGRNTTG